MIAIWVFISLLVSLSSKTGSLLERGGAHCTLSFLTRHMKIHLCHGDVINTGMSCHVINHCSHEIYKQTYCKDNWKTAEASRYRNKLLPSQEGKTPNLITIWPVLYYYPIIRARDLHNQHHSIFSTLTLLFLPSYFYDVIILLARPICRPIFLIN